MVLGVLSASAHMRATAEETPKYQAMPWAAGSTVWASHNMFASSASPAASPGIIRTFISCLWAEGQAGAEVTELL